MHVFDRLICRGRNPKCMSIDYHSFCVCVWIVFGPELFVAGREWMGIISINRLFEFFCYAIVGVCVCVVAFGLDDITCIR